MFKDDMKEDEAIEKLLQFISSPYWGASAKSKMRMFDGAIPFFGPFVNIDWFPNPGYWYNAAPDATGTLTDITILGGFNAGRIYNTPFLMHRIRYLSKSAIKMDMGYLRKEAGTVHIIRSSWVRHNDKVVLSRVGGKKRPPIHSSSWYCWNDSQDGFEKLVCAAPGIYFNMYHAWSVYFRMVGGISVRFPIDPRIALALFADREKEQGKIRRDALMHWVKAHMRRKPSSDTDWCEVRKYIRGKTDFFWHGFECQIAPDDDYLNLLKKESA